MMRTPPHPASSADIDQHDVKADPVPIVDPAEPTTHEPDTLRLLQETLDVSKREVVAGAVRVSTRTEAFEHTAEIALHRNVVDVTRVAIGRLVDVAPTVRTEGDTTIVPVIEERFVIVKQLYLKEELHLRHRVETEVSHVPVTLRRQHAVVERVDADGRVIPDASPEA